MNNMMSGMGTSMFIWIVLITLICLLIIGACAWLVARLLNKQKASTTQYVPQPRDAYEEYEQGYQPATTVALEDPIHHMVIDFKLFVHKSRMT